SGDVDVAAIDCITYALLARCRPGLVERTRIIAQTMPAPVSPYVTHSSTSPEFIARLRGALGHAIHDPILAMARADLLLEEVEILSVEDYERTAQLEAEAKRLGYRDFETV